ncbi:CheR family methyltransferase [Aquisalimonas asiatica]|uniref:protein-glutamate O-methyltransferase n=1 Tax=Aquisalimonas asiatica TaxID=406100 RepID=A0A1H8TQ05_9GAMM|nr:CheR family methyltransferase [Aquisalimonas asiatica]SEO93062.1 chemotaxis protein methyltransferase CheR [Aquisalimonas asiatica]
MAAADQQRGDLLQASGLPEMDDRQFACWASLLERRTGMTMPPERKSFLVTSVGLRMREVGFQDYDAYYRHLQSGVAGNLEWAALVDRLTVHETRFFRDPAAVQYVADTALPERIDHGQDELSLWSVGCSTGEEVYTLAMSVADGLARHGSTARFGVTGTDISLQALSVGRSGVYPARRLRDIPQTAQAAFCEPVPGQNHFRIKAGLRRRVCFAQMNVLNVHQARRLPMDIIYCQNLLIYFDWARRQAIVDGLAQHLRPGGLLILGAGELVRGHPEQLERVTDAGDVLAFRRPTQ